MTLIFFYFIYATRLQNCVSSMVATGKNNNDADIKMSVSAVDLIFFLIRSLLALPGFGGHECL